MGRPKKRSLAADITHQQYERGWDLYSTQHNIAQIVVATGLSRNQLGWLIKVGDPDAGMPSYQSRMAEFSVEIRKRAVEVADQIGKDAQAALKGSAQITVAAQTTIRNIQAAHIEWQVKPAIERMKREGRSGEALAEMAMPKELRQTIKVLAPLAQFDHIARAWRMVFDSPHQVADPLQHGHNTRPKIDLSAETVLPASVAAIEELPGGEGDIQADPLDTMSEYKDMSLEEIEHWMETGELPDRLYADEYAQSTRVIDVDAGEPDGV